MQSLRNSIFLFLFIFSFFNSFSQEELKVRIVDIETKEAIPYATIIVVEQTAKAADENGYCSFNIKQFPVVLEISNIGYQKIFISINKALDTAQYIGLKKETLLLDEITISAERIERVYADDIMSVMDYEFIDGKMIILGFKNRHQKSYLILRNIFGSVIHEIPCPSVPKELYQDCFGNVHLLCKKNFYQIRIDDKKIELYNSRSMDEFDKLLRPWDVYIDNKLYYREVSEDFFAMNIGYFDEILKEKVLISTISNETSIVEKYDKRERKFMGIAPRALTIDLHGFQKHYDNAIHFKKIEAEYFLKDSMVHVLDFTHKNLLVYDSKGILEKSYYLNFYEETGSNFMHDLVRSFITGKGWTFETHVYQDLITKDVYLLCQRSGKTGVYYLDTKSGKLISVVELTHPYPVNIKIYDQKIYYEYRGEGSNIRMRIYRQDLT